MDNMVTWSGVYSYRNKSCLNDRVAGDENGTFTGKITIAGITMRGRQTRWHCVFEILDSTD